MLEEHRSQIAACLAAAIEPLAGPVGIELPLVSLERPKQAEHGDLACSVALQLAKPLRRAPREVAQTLVDALLADPAARPWIAGAEVAGPGFINLRVTAAVRAAALVRALAQGEAFGRGHRGAGRRLLIEFVSANPTGPLHVGHGRQGALGDVLAALLAADGWQVEREFYYNDAGNQIENLARSVQARARGVTPEATEFPVDGYRGDYILEIAQRFLARDTVAARDVAPLTASGDVDDLDAIRRFAVACLRHEQDLDLQAFGVHFDRYYLESSLYTEARVAAVVAALIESGHAYEAQGALWLRTTTWGDDKDRVMRKSDGTYTYFVPDLAYHQTKWERGFARAINVQGSDHHGTIARVRAGLQALGIGIPLGWPDYVLHKMVTVLRGGVEVKISKRAGGYVTLRDLIEWSGHTPESGRDAVRFFLISRKADAEFTFDVDLARSHSDENPVYYVQYAHARICSVLAQAGADAGSAEQDYQLPVEAFACLDSSSEAALMARLSEWPATVQAAVDELAPHLIAYYLRDLAADFHRFYNSQRVLVEDRDLRAARLALLAATRQVLRNGLGLIGVAAPQRM